MPGAGLEVRALLEAGTTVTLVVDHGHCSWEVVGMLATARLVSRRAEVPLVVRIDDAQLRALVHLVGLSEVVEG